MICNRASRQGRANKAWSTEGLKIWQKGQEGPTRVMANNVVDHAVAKIGTTLDQGKGYENKPTDQPIRVDLDFQRETFFGACGYRVVADVTVLISCHSSLVMQSPHVAVSADPQGPGPPATVFSICAPCLY